MADINVRKRGKAWEYRFEVAGIGGQRKQKSKGGFRTKNEAQKAGVAALGEYNDTGQTTTLDSNVSYADFIEMWHKEYVVMNLGISTQKAYRSIIDNHIKPEIGSYRISSITHTTLQGLLNKKSMDGLKRKTLNTILAILKGSFRYARLAKGIIKSNPALELLIPRSSDKGGKAVKAYSVDEVAAFAKKLKGSPAYYPLMISYYTGMRAGEIFALSWDDIDFGANTITISKTMLRGNAKGTQHTQYMVSTPKTKQSNRTIGFGPALSQIFKELKTANRENEVYYGQHYTCIYTDKNGSVFVSKKENTPAHLKKLDLIMRKENGEIFSQNAMYLVLRKMLGNEFKFHNLRHTHATVLVEQGVPIKEVQNRLGHVTIVTTLDLYVESTETMERMAAHAIEKAWTNRGQNDVPI